MATLVVGAILFLLFMNDTGRTGSVTSAIVGENRAEDNAAGASVDEEEIDAAEKEFVKKIEQGPHDVDLALSFSSVPHVYKETRIKEVDVHFDDVSTSIKVNGDRLSLDTLEGTVSMVITGFRGTLDFDALELSMKGSAKGLIINGISLSSKGNLEISFNDLEFSYLSLEDIELKDLELPTGDGLLQVGEKFQYELEQDELKVYHFNGKAVIDHAAENALALEGVARGVSVSGALMDLTLS